MTQIELENTEENQAQSNLDSQLHTDWTFWCLEPSRERNKTWDDFLKNINTVSSVVQFWSTLNHMKLPLRLDSGMDYYFFRDGIKPIWEDPANSNGGAWTLTIRRTRDVDQFWINTLLALIGEQFIDEFGKDCCDMINGCRIQIRMPSKIAKNERKDKISLWTKYFDDEDTQKTIGHIWQKILDANIAAGSMAYDCHDSKKVGQIGRSHIALYNL
ncbi:hypothetical protein GJ496_011952 [Pomphorhynchus laevis]|nr:hypothetical protein GJ496_011952 [Pomphorhynchus laevis]